MPVHNCAQFLREAIESVLNQTFQTFEFIIVNDGSIDETSEILDEYAKKDWRVRIINQPNCGIVVALNRGLKEAKGEWIFRMDGDDISLPNRLWNQIKYLKQNQSIDILSCQYAAIINNKIKYVVKSCKEHTEIRNKLVLHSDILHPGVIYNKNTILKYGGYKNVPIEDFELWLRIKDKVIFGNIPEILMLKRYHSKAISQQLEAKNAAAYNYLSKYYSDLSKEFEVSDINLFKGWREYFYGNKNKARYYFKRINLKSLNYKILAASLITLFNKKLFALIKELRLRYLLKYWLTYYNRDNRFLRKSKKELQKLMRN